MDGETGDSTLTNGDRRSLTGKTEGNTKREVQGPREYEFKSGDLARVRDEAAIRKMLDANGMLEGVPFMPEMGQFCGKTFRVYKRADKVCVEGKEYLEVRRLRNTVFLDELRCDGSEHDGCQRMCLMFWKEEWLEPVPEGSPVEPRTDWPSRFEREHPAALDPTKTFVCQSTTLYDATEPMSAWEFGQYRRDIRSRTLDVWDVVRVFFFMIYNKFARVAGLDEFGALGGNLQKTPVVSLALRAGEKVVVKSKNEIVATIDPGGRNRGLQISYEMIRHAGKEFEVLRRIDRMILERTGKMREIQNTVLLDGTACSGICVRGCARSSHPMWREAWVRRAAEGRAKENAGCSITSSPDCT